MSHSFLKKYTSKMLDIKAHVEKLFGELQKNLKEFPQRTESLVTETKEKVLVAIQQSNSSIFSDLLDQMQPMNFENLP